MNMVKFEGPSTARNERERANDAEYDRILQKIKKESSTTKKNELLKEKFIQAIGEEFARLVKEAESKGCK
ncbi:MAG: hypothetical protein JWO53_1176 [Chlamydiia bacterium]|nr:hypothetical protein [Chlamydiia bacterium]